MFFPGSLLVQHVEISPNIVSLPQAPHGSGSLRCCVALFCGTLAARSAARLPHRARLLRSISTGNSIGATSPAFCSVYSTNGNLTPAPDFLSPAYDDSSWQTVNIPHDYIVEGAFDPKADEAHGYLPVEPAWYRKTISIPAFDPGRRLWLEFDGVYRDSQMWLNGHFLGRHDSGYTSFRYDISAVARPGTNNLLVVHVDPTRFEGWWYEGGGIYRHTRLVSVAPTHMAPWGVHVVAKVGDSGAGIRADARLEITTTIANDAAVANRATVLSEVINADGAVVATQRTTDRLAAKDSFDFRSRSHCPMPICGLASTLICTVSAPVCSSAGRRWIKSPPTLACAPSVSTQIVDFF